jgi:ApaG protein
MAFRIPEDCVIELLAYLNSKELIQLRCSKSLYRMIQFSAENVWKKLTYQDYRILEKQHPANLMNNHNELVDMNNSTWFSIYRHYTTQFAPRYRAILPKVIGVWHKLMNCLKENYPEIYSTLQPGLSEAEIQAVESKFAEYSPNYPLPADYLLFLRFFDGQKSESESSQHWTALFGGFEFYSFECDFRWNSLRSSMQRAEAYRRALHHNKLQLIPITRSEVGGQAVCTFFLHVSTGKVVRIDRATIADDTYYIVANSFTQFMADFAEKLESGILGRGRSSVISRFPQQDICGSDTITNAIRIRVSVLYVPEQNSLNQFFFTYHIVMTYEGEDDRRCQLTNRHWKITDSNGRVERVDGPGVVGYHPTMYRGCDQFEYESCCPLTTERGTMEGSFEFESESGESFHALINPFIFDVNRNSV